MFIDMQSSKDVVAYIDGFEPKVVLIPRSLDIAQNRDDAIDIFEAINLVLMCDYAIEIHPQLINQINID